MSPAELDLDAILARCEAERQFPLHIVDADGYHVDTQAVERTEETLALVTENAQLRAVKAAAREYLAALELYNETHAKGPAAKAYAAYEAAHATLSGLVSTGGPDAVR